MRVPVGYANREWLKWTTNKGRKPHYNQEGYTLDGAINKQLELHVRTEHVNGSLSYYLFLSWIDHCYLDF